MFAVVFYNKCLGLVLFHVVIISLSNLLVQYPFSLWGWHSTWGIFSYPFIFLATDLTTRVRGRTYARQIVWLAMLPGLLSSLVLSNVLISGAVNAIRIAVACMCAYVIGQLFDIMIFDKLRRIKSWWKAPVASSVFGNVVDTYAFFFIAFFHSKHTLMASYWPEIATIDLIFKLIMSLVVLVPLYGIIFRCIKRMGLPIQDPKAGLKPGYLPKFIRSSS